jgi:hypothetical protein
LKPVQRRILYTMLRERMLPDAKPRKCAGVVGTALRDFHPHGDSPGMADFAQGSTFVDAAVAMVPRSLWPDKPVIAGSGDLVSDYTGITFAAGTSVGVGQVLEAYVNFGRTGVVATFLALGLIISYLDRRASIYLRRGQLLKFLKLYLPGLGLLQVGGAFSEATSTAAAALLVVIGVKYLAERLYPDRRQDARPAALEAGRPHSPEHNT